MVAFPQSVTCSTLRIVIVLFYSPTRAARRLGCSWVTCQYLKNQYLQRRGTSFHAKTHDVGFTLRVKLSVFPLLFLMAVSKKRNPVGSCRVSLLFLRMTLNGDMHLSEEQSRTNVDVYAKISLLFMNYLLRLCSQLLRLYRLQNPLRRSPFFFFFFFLIYVC